MPTASVSSSQRAADTADLWFDPSANNNQQSDAASLQMQAQYAEQEAATVQAAAADNWEYVLQLVARELLS
jgi:hypothetical protein